MHMLPWLPETEVTHSYSIMYYPYLDIYSLLFIIVSILDSVYPVGWIICSMCPCYCGFMLYNCHNITVSL